MHQSFTGAYKRRVVLKSWKSLESGVHETGIEAAGYQFYKRISPKTEILTFFNNFYKLVC